MGRGVSQGRIRKDGRRGGVLDDVNRVDSLLAAECQTVERKSRGQKRGLKVENGSWSEKRAKRGRTRSADPGEERFAKKQSSGEMDL